MRSVRIPGILWEFAQNLPLVTGFFVSLQYWKAGTLGWAVVSAFAGSTLGALIIRATEARIVAGHREPPCVVVANVMVTAALMLLFAAYLSAPWSRWWIDVAAGIPAGILLGAVQDLTAGERIGRAHCLAMAVALALGLVVIRLLSETLPIAGSVLVVASVLTITIYVIDYLIE